MFIDYVCAHAHIDVCVIERERGKLLVWISYPLLNFIFYLPY